MIALAGLDAETGLVMLLYLDNSYERFKADGKMMNSKDDLWCTPCMTKRKWSSGSAPRR